MTRLALLALLVASPAWAQSPGEKCMKRPEFIKNVGAKCHEVQRLVGLGDGFVMELYIAEDSETWTLTITYPSEMTCPKVSGTGFAFVDAVRIIPGQPG